MATPDEGAERKPVSAAIKVVCDRAECDHRSPAGWCYVGDPQWKYQHSANRVMLMLCSSYQKGG